MTSKPGPVMIKTASGGKKILITVKDSRYISDRNMSLRLQVGKRLNTFKADPESHRTERPMRYVGEILGRDAHQVAHNRKKPPGII